MAKVSMIKVSAATAKKFRAAVEHKHGTAYGLMVEEADAAILGSTIVKAAAKAAPKTKNKKAKKAAPKKAKAAKAKKNKKVKAAKKAKLEGPSLAEAKAMDPDADEFEPLTAENAKLH